MENEEYLKSAVACFRDCLPPCTVACPLSVDVRGMVEKMQRGNYTAALRLYRNAVLFPAIVARLCPEPCRKACVRKMSDESIHMRQLEEACVNYAKNTRPTAYNVPKKPQRIAIIGAGLSGLSCGLKLAAKNYDVTIHCRSDQPGGNLHQTLPTAEYLTEIELQFSQVRYDLRRNSAVENLDTIEADAVFVATGRGGDDFGLLDGLDHVSLATVRKGVFMGGGLLTTGPIEAIEHGIRASVSIEKYLKVGSMGGNAESMKEIAVNPHFYSLPMKKTLPAFEPGIVLNEAQADAEAHRCLRCNCSQCRDRCEMMEWFRTFPQRMVTDIVASKNAIERLTEHVAQRMVNSCTQCGVCREVCPVSVDMEASTLQARREFFKDGSLPPAFHDFWLRDMEHANGSAGFIHMPLPGQSRYLFFPGCQLGASDSSYVINTYEYLKTLYPDTALMQACCGVSAEWAGNEELCDRTVEYLKNAWVQAGKPVILTACPTCHKTLSRYFPECEVASIYKFLNSHWPGKLVGTPSRTILYDPCSSKYVPGIKEDVRKIVDRLGLDWSEPPEETARCCGYGGHIYSANRELAEAIVEKRRATFGVDREYLCYCANCRDVFAGAGQSARHVLDILFTDNSPDRAAPSLTERRANRLEVRDRYQPVREKHDPAAKYELEIPDAVRLKMDRLLVLEEDVLTVIDHCERTGAKIRMPDSGLYTGHFRQGIITYWVTYGDSGENRFSVVNVYSHRMAIEERDAPEPK